MTPEIKQHIKTGIVYTVACIGFCAVTSSVDSKTTEVVAFFGLLWVLVLWSIRKSLHSIDDSLKRIADKIDVK